MPDWFVPVLLTFLGSTGVGTVIGYWAQKRNIDMKAKSEQQTSIVSDTENIREMYRGTLEDMEKKHTRDELEWEKERAKLKEDLRLKDALLEKDRQQLGEMLVTIDDLKKTVNRVGDDVTRVTGDFGKYPLAGESKAFGRRATDQP